jgi:hypothetical protein
MHPVEAKILRGLEQYRPFLSDFSKGTCGPVRTDGENIIPYLTGGALADFARGAPPRDFDVVTAQFLHLRPEHPHLRPEHPPLRVVSCAWKSMNYKSDGLKVMTYDLEHSQGRFQVDLITRNTSTNENQWDVTSAMIINSHDLDICKAWVDLHTLDGPHVGQWRYDFSPIIREIEEKTLTWNRPVLDDDSTRFKRSVKRVLKYGLKFPGHRLVIR